VEAFPWLESLWAQGADSPTEVTGQIPLEQGSVLSASCLIIADLATEHFRNWDISRLFPYVPSLLSVTALRLAVRSNNALSRTGITDFSGLGDLTVTDLFRIRAMGAGTVENILLALALANIKHASRPAAYSFEDIESPKPKNESLAEGTADKVLRALNTLARWQFVRNAADEPLVPLSAVGDGTPFVVSDAYDLIRGLTAQTWGEPVEYAQVNTPELIELNIGVLDPRQKAILVGRILDNPTRTLDSIGAELGVTRERVRQIESKILATVASWLSPETELGLHAAAVRNRIGKLVTLERLLSIFPDLKVQISDTDRPAWYVLDQFDDNFESDGTWVALPSIHAVTIETSLKFDQAASAAGVCRETDLESVAAEWGMALSELRSWLSHLGYRELLGHWIAPNLRSLPDLAYAALYARGAAASVEEVMNVLNVERSTNSLRNALAADSRFVRVDVRLWGLRDRGTSEYSGIRTAIAAAVDVEGQITVDELVADLTDRYAVSPSSILAYASTWPFETVGRMVKRATVAHAPRRSLSQTKNLYARGESIFAYKFKVNSEHLRGSGTPMPSSLAVGIGLQPGEKFQLSASTKPITISWITAQPSFGSVRQQLIELDAQEGDDAILELSGTHASIRLVRKNLPQSEPRARALALIGLDDGTQFESAPFCRALGLGESAPWPSIVHVLRDRGETELATSIVEALGDDSVFDQAIAPIGSSKFSIVAIEELE
jgi:hypothetical protein